MLIQEQPGARGDASPRELWVINEPDNVAVRNYCHRAQNLAG